MVAHESPLKTGWMFPAIGNIHPVLKLLTMKMNLRIRPGTRRINSAVLAARTGDKTNSYL